MKNNIIGIFLMALVLGGCSSAYQTSQTPDDVYYSPGRSGGISGDNYQDYSASNDDQYLRMKVQNRSQWGGIDDFSYWYDSRYYSPAFYNPYGGYYYNPYLTYSPYGYYNPYGYGHYGYSHYNSFGFSMGYNSYSPYGYSPWYSWNQPYYTVVYYKNPQVYYSTNRTNANGYNNRSYNNSNNNRLIMPRSNNNYGTYSTPTSTDRRRPVYTNENSYDNSNSTISRPSRSINNSNNTINNNSNNNSNRSSRGSTISGTTAPRSPRPAGNGIPH